MSGLAAFLRHAKETLSSCKKTQVVLGNESCDLDSAVSAIAYAFLLHSLRAGREDSDGVGVVPVLNIPRRDFPLRTEVTYWLGKHGVSQEALVFRDEIELHELHRKGFLQLFLVDHNILPAGDTCLESAVCCVIDHHRLERQLGAGGDDIQLEMVGSCSTLIAERILRENKTLLEDEDAVRLLHGTIILDTINLNEDAKRATPKDVQVVEELEKMLKTPPDRAQVFAEVTSAKGDVSSLTTEELLRKAVERDIAVYSKDEALRTSLTQHLEQTQNGLLQLVSLDSPVAHCEAYQQKNYVASRKIVLPMVKEWLAKNG